MNLNLSFRLNTCNLIKKQLSMRSKRDFLLKCTHVLVQQKPVFLGVVPAIVTLTITVFLAVSQFKQRILLDLIMDVWMTDRLALFYSHWRTFFWCVGYPLPCPVPSSVVKSYTDSLILKLYENDVAEQKYEITVRIIPVPCLPVYLENILAEGKECKGACITKWRAHQTRRSSAGEPSPALGGARHQTHDLQD